MELRKYREFEETPKLRVLKSPGNDTKEPIKGFVTLIIATMILSVAVTIAIVTFSMRNPKQKKHYRNLLKRASSANTAKTREIHTW
jgi:hypothetical protein